MLVGVELLSGELASLFVEVEASRADTDEAFNWVILTIRFIV
jgi:hypothetical protein